MGFSASGIRQIGKRGKNMVYFDNAATSYPKPAIVLQGVKDAVTLYGGNPGRSGHDISLHTAEKVFEAREKLADFFHAEVENVVFTLNCTHALNMAIKGALAKGGHVVTSCLEHNSVIRPLETMKRRQVITYSVAKVYEGAPEATIASFAERLRPDTRAIVCTHASNVTGTILPIKQLGQLCKKRGLLFIVDAAQSAGVLPIDMEECGINILCCAGHKSLLGTTGTGLMILRKAGRLRTIMEGGTGSVSNQLTQPDFTPDRYETGTINTVGALSLAAGMEFIALRGRETIYRHELALCRKAYEGLRMIKGVTLYTSAVEEGVHAPVLSFNVAGMTSMETVEQLNASGYALRGGLHCSPMAHKFLGTSEIGTARFAPGVFSSESEVDGFLFAVKKIVDSHVQ